jgi:hypothetical protein
MTIRFTELQGKAAKAGPERYKPPFGTHSYRIVGNVVPSYKYWLKTRDGTPVPMECLGFNRETETFENKVRDVVREYIPEIKRTTGVEIKGCSWAYQSFIIDREDGVVKLFDHKKKLFGAILDAAKKKMGDPTDPDKGWDVVFTKKKTGPQTFNVEYTLETFDLKNSPLSEKDKAAIKEAGVIEDITKVQTPEEQEAFIKNFVLPEEAEVETEVEEELKSPPMEDDIPM